MMFRPLFLACIIHTPLPIAGWGSNNDDVDQSIFGMSLQRDWLSSDSIKMKVEGCVWGVVDDREDALCMEDESEDGSTLWYQMANCRRAQVAYSVYASGSTSCNNKDFKESFVTTSGISNFASILGSYSYYSPITDDAVAEFPICDEDGNGYYMSVGCSSSGTFTIDRFLDAYCLEYYDTYDTLSDFNKLLSSDFKCFDGYDSTVDESYSYSMISYLLSDSSSCSEIDSPLCTTSSFVGSAGSSNALSSAGNRIANGLSLSLTNKIKYVIGGSMLIASLAMFIGILFTNRRKRRAMLQRKRQRKRRSRSKTNKTSRKPEGDNEDGSRGGVFA